MSSSSEHRLVSHPHQSLLTHLEHVDEVSRLALARKVLGADFFADVDVDYLRRLLVWFHDFGKGTDFFQWRIVEVARKENTKRDGLDREYVDSFLESVSPFVAQIGREGGELRGHSQLGAFISQTVLPDNTDPVLRAILYEAIARHHGNLKNMDGGVERAAEDFTELLDEQWKHMNHTDYRALLSGTGFDYAAELEVVKQRNRKNFFTSLYVRRLAKNRSLRPYLQAVFLYSLLLSGDKGDLMLPRRDLVGRGRRCRGRLIEQYKRATFGEPGGSEMNQWREEAYQRVEDNLAANPAAGFYSITLPTGMGKTLTAYNAAIQLQNSMADRYAADGTDCVPRIIYCLPFTSVIDQNAAILQDILALEPDMEGELATHHYLADWVDHKGGSEDKLDYSEKEYLIEGWEYTITVTTFVQLLETLVSNRNRKLRKFHNLANAIVVLDEVQNIPPKYFDVVRQLLPAVHEHLGTRFVFVTATQPFLLRDEDLVRPVVELTDPTKAYTRRVFERMNRIDLDLSLWIDGPETIEEQCPLFAREVREHPETNYLFILNLVKESQLVYRTLCEEQLPDTTYLYLSSAILPVLRKEIIARVKNRKDFPGRVVVVSTQVVEAGVDIDLDVVYRAFAPLDSINQSAGRCNRNMAAGFRGSVRLFKNQQSAAKIYDPALLDKTRRTLSAQLEQEGQQEDYRPGIIPEGRFYAMNERYAREVDQAVADGSDVSAKILKDLYALRFEAAADEFKLIRKTYQTYGIYIDDPVRLPRVKHREGEQELWLDSTETWERMEIIFRNYDDRWECKQHLRLLRPALLQYVVQVPEQYLPEEVLVAARERPFVRCTDGATETTFDYNTFYSFTTGYFKPEETPPTTCL